MKVKALIKIAKNVCGEKNVGGYIKGQEFELDAGRAAKWIEAGLVEEVKPAPQPEQAKTAESKPAAKKASAKKSASKKTAASSSDKS